MRERDTHPEGGEERRDKPLEHGQGNSKKGRKRKKKAKEKGEEEENSGGVREERQAYEEDGEDNAVVMAENLNEKDVRGGGKKEGSVPRTVLHGEAFSSQRSASSSYSTIKSIPASDVPHVGGVTASSSGRIVEEREERTGHGKNGGSDTAQAKATKTPPSSSSSTASPIAAPHMRAKKIPHHSRKQVRSYIVVAVVWNRLFFFSHPHYLLSSSHVEILNPSPPFLLTSPPFLSFLLYSA